MSKFSGFRLLSFFVLIMLIFSLTCSVFAETSAPAVTDSTTPSTSADGPFGTSPETTLKPDTSSAPGMSSSPDSSSMMNPDITTTPDTANNGDNMGDDDGGFNYTGLIIALAIAAAVILLVILLVPKNKNKR